MPVHFSNRKKNILGTINFHDRLILRMLMTKSVRRVRSGTYTSLDIDSAC